MHPSGVVRTYREVDDASIRLARVLRERGLGPGDHVAVLLDNQPEFYDVVWAAQRIGCYVTPINWHLTADEAGYIVARLRRHRPVRHRPARRRGRADGRRPRRRHHAHRVDGDLPGFERYDDARRRRRGRRARRTSARAAGCSTRSGTTGQPKGILPPLLDVDLGAKSFLTMLLDGPVRLHQRRRVPQPGAAVPRRPGRLDDRHAAPRRHRGRDGALRPARAAGRHRAPPRHPRAARADPHDPAAQAHRRGAVALRPLEPADGRARGGAVPGRGEAGDASTGSARSSTSSTAAARAPASATSARRTGSPTPARSASR